MNSENRPAPDSLLFNRRAAAADPEAINFVVLHQFHCDFSLSDGESGFSTFPA
jgi:hypothetical protein